MKGPVDHRTYDVVEVALDGRKRSDFLSQFNFAGRCRGSEAFLGRLNARLPIPDETSLPV